MLLFNVITEFSHVIMAHPCRHDLIMSAIYLLAVPTVILWGRRVWVIYLMKFAAYALAALEAAGLL
jgi:hypothetical protein